MDRRVVIIFLICMVLSGCTQTLIVEKLGFIHSVGYELNEDRQSDKEGNIIMTVAIPQIAITAQEDQEVLSIVAHSSKDGKYNIARKSDRHLVSGQKRTALFSKDLAEQGVIELLDSLNRDPAIGSNLNIIVVDGSSREVLDTNYPEHPRTSRYIFELIEKESRMMASVVTTIHHFMRDYYDDGIDPIAPIIKKGEGEIIIDGIGLFQDDRYVMKIDPNDARIFMMLHGNYEGGNITTEIELENDPRAALFFTFNTLESNRKIKVIQESADKITVNLHVDVKATTEEIMGSLDMANDKVQIEIEKALAKHIEKVSKELIKQMQAENIDSIGIGQYVRNKIGYRKWHDLQWREVFPNVIVNVNADVKLKGFGSTK